MKIRVMCGLLSGLMCHACYGEDSLCRATENIVFACHFGQKMVALCSTSNNTKVLTYRFGQPKAIELSVSESKHKNRFRILTSPLYGGGLTTVSFSRGEYEYKLYSKVSRSESEDSTGQSEPVFEDGLIIVKSHKQIKQLICDDGGNGFREDIQ